MRLLTVCVVFLVAASPVAAGAAPPRAVPSVGASAGEDGASPAPFTYRDGRLAALVEELERTSPTAARMLAVLRDFGMPVVFGSVDSVLEEVRSAHHDYDPFRERALGFMAPVLANLPGTDAPVATSVVIGVNLERLDELFDDARRSGGPDVDWTEIQRLETLALLGHEVVHAWGLVASAGDPRRGCRDPEMGQAPEESCVVVGENLIRRELGAPLDWGYGLPRLAELPGRYAELRRRRVALHSIGDVARSLLHTRLVGVFD